MSTHKPAPDFLGKYYPGIKRMLHESRIKRIREILRTEEEKYENIYNEKYV